MFLIKLNPFVVIMKRKAKIVVIQRLKAPSGILVWNFVLRCKKLWFLIKWFNNPIKSTKYAVPKVGDIKELRLYLPLKVKITMNAMRLQEA